MAGTMTLSGWSEISDCREKMRCSAVLRDNMSCTVGFVTFFFVSFPWQHGTRQQDWYISETKRKQFPNLTLKFILFLKLE